jgi:hypothetical protein
MKNEQLEQARIVAIVDDVLEALDLSWFTVRNRFTTENGEDRVLAQTEPDWEYRQASIEWNLGLTCARTDLELRRDVVHEIVHVLVSPMEQLIQVKAKSVKIKLCELAVENVTRAIMEVLP